MFLTRSLLKKKSSTIITFLSILLVLLDVYSGFFGVGKFGKNFLGYPDLNRDQFLGIQNNLKNRGSPCLFCEKGTHH